MVKLSGARDKPDSSILCGLQTVEIVTMETRKHHIAVRNFVMAECFTIVEQYDINISLISGLYL